MEDPPTQGSKASGAMGGGVSRPKAVDAEQTQAEGHGGTAGQSPPRCVSGIDMHRKEGVKWSSHGRVAGVAQSAPMATGSITSGMEEVIGYGSIIQTDVQ